MSRPSSVASFSPATVVERSLIGFAPGVAFLFEHLAPLLEAPRRRQVTARMDKAEAYGSFVKGITCGRNLKSFSSAD